MGWQSGQESRCQELVEVVNVMFPGSRRQKRYSFLSRMPECLLRLQIAAATMSDQWPCPALPCIASINSAVFYSI